MSTELNESISAIFVRPISFKVGIKLDTWTTFTEKILTQTNKFQFDAVVQTSQSKISPRSKNCPIFTLHSTHFISLAREHQVEQICSILCLSNWFQIKATVFFPTLTLNLLHFPIHVHKNTPDNTYITSWYVLYNFSYDNFAQIEKRLKMPFEVTREKSFFKYFPNFRMGNKGKRSSGIFNNGRAKYRKMQQAIRAKQARNAADELRRNVLGPARG